MRLLVVGQAPSRSTDDPALDPLRPLGPLRVRLARLLGVRPERLGEVAEFRNLLPRWPGRDSKGDLFPIGAAREAASGMEVRDRTLVLLGRNVARAFGVPASVPFLVWTEVRGTPAAILPHPSGIVLWWNDPRNVRRAVRFLRRTLREGPPEALRGSRSDEGRLAG